jgi:hypothetical protein
VIPAGAQPIVVEFAESVADAQDLVDQEVDRFGGAVADPAGGEVGQDLRASGRDGAGQPRKAGTCESMQNSVQS